MHRVQEKLGTTRCPEARVETVLQLERQHSTHCWNCTPSAAWSIIWCFAVLQGNDTVAAEQLVSLNVTTVSQTVLVDPATLVGRVENIELTWWCLVARVSGMVTHPHRSVVEYWN